jgi:hypothetical protein
MIDFDGLLTGDWNIPQSPLLFLLTFLTLVFLFGLPQ